jgi:serine/threonine protein kinase
VVEGSPQNYDILRRIGTGPNGQVFRARAPDGQEVALKFIWCASNSEPETRRQLEVFRGLGHPFLLRTRTGYLGAEQLVLETEVADEDLNGWLARCRRDGQAGIPAVPLLGYLDEAAEALDFLKAEQVIPCNLKPSNLLRLGGHARVADFVPWPVPQPAHHFSGLPVYLAPEQWRDRPSARSDQYSLALLYFQMRTGRLPFDAQSGAALVMQMLQGNFDLGELPKIECSVLRRALAHEPEQRYGSCSELVWTLQQAVAGDCVRRDSRASPVDPSWLAWNDGTVVRLAQAVIEEQAFDRLPILADALEEAGCTNEDLLTHCREAGPHFRRCWVLRRILGPRRRS